ncbi:MAG: acyl-CoA synthetase FdrA [Elusimicrobia bacterium]|nr:acyl-CoA synthetase FdrA [Elusimicrobiota bacterium]
MVIKGRIKSGEYFDSVTLMIVGRDLAAMPGVKDAALVMGAKENQAILKSSGLWLAEFENAGDTDLLLAVKAESEDAAGKVLLGIDEQLKNVRSRADAEEEHRPKSFEGGLKALPGANVALISITGRYAGEEAMKALKAGLHVMLFSDNVPIEKEVELKEYALERGLLVMGPDCGTAIINGVPLAFANVVSRGDVGIVAAAGTGLQEISSIVSNEGAGISQAIGTGGRDVKKEVRGIMFLEGLKALLEDPSTRVIVLVSKPPHESVLRKIGKTLKGVRKPVIAVFLGAEDKALKRFGMIPAANLEEAALIAAAISKGSDAEAARRALVAREHELSEAAIKEAEQAAKGQKYVRGLFSGGTFCTEAQLVFKGIGIEDVHSNVPLPPFAPLADAWKSERHTLVDLGEDAFTVGRPHPMIDYSLRGRRIQDEAKDPETALILLDVVIGHGSNMDPVRELAPVIRDAKSCAEQAGRRLIFACSVTGTPEDPQDKAKVEEGLKAAGALVFRSNAAAAKFAARAAEYLEGE